MTKIIIEHATKKPKVGLSVFVDENKVGTLNRTKPLGVDVSAGSHTLKVGFGTKAEGAVVSFSVGEGETKKIKTSLSRSALSAARRSLFWAAITGFLVSFSLGLIVAIDKAMAPSHHTAPTYQIVFSGFMIFIFTHILLSARWKKNPKNFVEIEVLE